MGFFDFLFGRKDDSLPQTGRGEVSAYTYEGTVIEYFDMLLEKHFGQYEAEMMVYPRNIDIRAEFSSYPITFLLRKSGRPVLALMLVPRDRCDTPAIQNTVNTCQGLGIPCLKFLNEERNERGEVLAAIRGSLEGIDK